MVINDSLGSLRREIRWTVCLVAPNTSPTVIWKKPGDSEQPNQPSFASGKQKSSIEQTVLSTCKSAGSRLGLRFLLNRLNSQ